MVFNSLDFAYFLPIVFVLYWSSSKLGVYWQNVVLLVASYVFYGWWDWRFVGLLWCSTAVDYWASQRMQQSKHPGGRKKLLWLSLFVNLGVLSFFKYYNFFADSFSDAFVFFGQEVGLRHLDIILPVGVSFYTFQSMGYTIDVYKKKILPATSFVGFAVYVGFFAQLVAGPIEKASNLLPQLLKKGTLKYKDLEQGAHLLLWGLFKKVVIADRLALVVDEIFNNAGEYYGLTFAMGAIFFAVQIYCDFSGYSDMAIGTARLFGIQLSKNFALPYFSSSLTVFWRRWHISLFQWFKDYVYIPLGGSQVGLAKQLWYVLLVFLLSGLWHGAQWTFVIWGAYHGWLYGLEKISQVLFKNKRWMLPFQHVLVLLALLLGWVIFRSNSWEDLVYILDALTSFEHYSWVQVSPYFVPLVKNSVFGIDVFLSVFLMVLLFSLEYIFTYQLDFESLPFKIRLPFYVFGVWMIYVVGVFEMKEFIYFQF